MEQQWEWNFLKDASSAPAMPEVPNTNSTRWSNSKRRFKEITTSRKHPGHYPDLFDERSFEQKFINLTADFISVALIEYSITNKIMMPKNAEKNLDLTEFNICLDINLENQTGSTTVPSAWRSNLPKI